MADAAHAARGDGRPPSISRRNFLGRSAALGVAAVVADFSPRRLDALTRAASHADGIPPETLADDDDFWREVREAFTVAPSVINLDNAAVSPSPRVVTESMVRHLWVEQEAPVIMQSTLGPSSINTARELAALLGCSIDEIALTRNATEALHNVLLGVELRRGDEVLTTTHDYWAMHNALDQRAAREASSAEFRCRRRPHRWISSWRRSSGGSHRARGSSSSRTP